jgi:hypothetical protein
MYIRFAAAEIHETSQCGLGIFQALYRLPDNGKLYPYEEEHLRTVSEWFDIHLEEPTRFTAAKRPYYRKESKAISWFKDSAHEHIAHIREMIAILENHGISVQMLRSDRVGYVVYEDEHQIVVEPFSDVQA